MKNILEELGFTPYEATIYLTLLENGQLSAYELAEKTGLYRQACYDALNRMMERGHTTSLREGRRQLYKAAKPEILLHELKDRQQSFQLILPQLKLLQQESEDPVKVEVFKGKNVLRLGFRDIIETLKKHGGENCCTSVDERHYQAFDPAAMAYYGREMQKNNFTERVIIPTGAKPFFRTSKYRVIPRKYFNRHPTQIYGDAVQIFVGGTPYHMILIRSKSVADSFRKQFELMWKTAEPLK